MGNQGRQTGRLPRLLARCRDVWLFSTSGGTELCTAFIGSVPLKPVRVGELQARSLGAKVEAYDEEGTHSSTRSGRW